MTSETSTDRPQRADARRNRERIVEAATSAFAESGLATQMDDIARRAGVGVGTVYRHFPTKDALVEALVEDHMAGMAAKGRALVEREDDGREPWDVFAGFLRECSESHLKDRAFAEVLAGQPASTFDAAAERSGLRAAGHELLRRAREAGQARPDASVDDISIVMCALGAVLQGFGREAGDRYMTLVLDGFRAGCESGAGRTGARSQNAAGA